MEHATAGYIASESPVFNRPDTPPGATRRGCAVASEAPGATRTDAVPLRARNTTRSTRRADLRVEALRCRDGQASVRTHGETAPRGRRHTPLSARRTPLDSRRAH